MIKFFFISAPLLSFVFASSLSAAGQVTPRLCQSDRVKLQILGSRGPELLDGQASTGYLLWLDNKARVLVDTGTGSLQRFKQSKADFNDVDIILFTHFHVDHSADFPSYIKGAFFSGRTKDLSVIGPTGSSFVVSAKEFVERSIGRDKGLYPYLGNVIEKNLRSAYKINTTNIAWSDKDLSIKKIYKQNGVQVKTVSTHHGPFPSQAYRVELAGCSISFSGDMSGQLGAVPSLIANSEIFVAHNAIPEDATGIAANLHMTPTMIGKIAQTAKVKKLLLTHLMERSLRVKPQTLALIHKQYKGPVSFPNDLAVIRP